MKDERMFLNQERVVDFLNVCIRSGKAAEAPGLLMSRYSFFVTKTETVLALK